MSIDARTGARPVLLDAFCGAGGAAVGYHRAGFDVVGVDIAPQPRYPFPFHQGDALEFIARHGREFEAIHASPPCQGYSRMRHLPWLKDKKYPLLIEPTRRLLEATGRLWVIENVEDAPLPAAIILCGQTFGLKVYRHRKFESNVMLFAPPHTKHREVIGSGRMLNDRQRPSASGMVSFAGHGRSAVKSGPAMGIDWMSRDELSQAIPPAYTGWIGEQLLRALAQERRST